MQLLRTVEALRRLHADRGPADATIGFVPTLGGLHRGHQALLERSIAENEVTVLSVFLNPTQFDQRADLDGYPASLTADCALAEELGVDALFCPTTDEIYPSGFHYRVSEDHRSRQREGACRPGHFEGVLTVVLKLLNLVRPHRAYFGEKDFQQLELVRGMVADFFLDVEIVACPTVRDADGLALSSRNSRLTPDDRERAAVFPVLLRAPRSAEAVAEALEERGFDVDYIEDADGRRFGAVHLGDVRLIDNVALDALARGAA